MNPLPASEPGRDDSRSGIGGWWRHRGPVGRLAGILLLFPAANALFTLAVLGYSTSGSTTAEDGVGVALFEVILAVYSMVGPLALAALIGLASRWAPLGMAVVAITCLLYTAATAWSHIVLVQDLDTSSTAALGFLFLPAYLAILLIPFAALTVLLHWLRHRRRSRQTSPSRSR